MNRLGRALAGIASDLDAVGARWALVGGLAVSARAEPRFTRDVDLAVGVANDGEAERLINDLRARGYQLLALVEQEAVDRLATARLIPPGEGVAGVVVDLLFASSGIEPELVAGAETFDVMEGVVVPVAGIGHLLALKVLSRDDGARPQDSADIRALLGCATPRDRSMAVTAVKLIAERGYARGRDLAADLATLLAEAGP